MTAENKQPEKGRAEEIWELEGRGLNQKEIAEELGVSTKTIRRERKKPAYIEIVEHNEDMYEQGLIWMENSGKDNLRAEAVKERGRRSRSTQSIVKDFALATEAKPLTPEQETAKFHREAKEREHQFYVVLQIQDWQWKRLELHFKGEDYSHIAKDWKRTGAFKLPLRETP